MRIECPNCQAGLEIGQPKPGNDRPRCKQCGQPFLIAISNDQPPKIRIGRVKAAPSSNTTSEASSAKNAAPLIGEKTVVTNLEATVDSAVQNKTRSTLMEKTISPSSGLDQAIDNTAVGSAGSIVVAKSKTVAESKFVTKGTLARPATARNAVADEGAMPARLAGYRLIRMLGRGAMGAVYEAKQVSLDRTVALKTIRDRLVNKPSALARFTREAYAAAQLNHHNVVQIYDFGEEAGQHYFSMERVDGASLDDVVKERGALEARLAATYIAQAARGLRFAHRSGMVHRDVKPANFLLSKDGVVKVADLGLVKVPDQQDVEADGDEASMLSRSGGSQVTMLGTAVGTPAYMAPEQSVDATQVDHRADIYSLGCTLYFLLTGKPPFDAPDVSTLLTQHAKAPVPASVLAVAASMVILVPGALISGRDTSATTRFNFDASRVLNGTKSLQPITSAQNSFPPSSMLKVPTDRLAKAGPVILLGFPAEFAPNLAGIDRVSHVMPRAIGDKGDLRSVL
ncbi:MAG TPA: hypothetical protein DDZ51_26535 [Planctomycetaceae bacterium]|nr:hypothetical protein [Planctomycetaceae bacterium]